MRLTVLWRLARKRKPASYSAATIFAATTFQPTVGLTPPRKQPSPHTNFRGRLILAEILGHALSKGFWFDQPLWVWRLGARAECHGGLFETKGQDFNNLCATKAARGLTAKN
jgi:hypothetical protein